MRASVVTRFGGPEVLRYTEDQPEAVPRVGEVTVDVTVAGVNFRDLLERGASGYGQRVPPFVAGVEGAGRRTDTGERVAWWFVPGSYAERAVADPAVLVPIPDGLDDDTACAALLQGLTAHSLCSSTHPVQEGDVVLVHGGSGGVGQLLVQMIKLRGGRVIATASSEAKATHVRGAGADHVIGYDDVAGHVRELTDGVGVDVVFDGLGKETFRSSCASLRPRGLLAVYGVASGQLPPLDLAELGASRSLFVTRVGLPAYTRNRAELLQRAGQVYSWITEGLLEVPIGGRYPLEQAHAAHVDLESRRTVGKLLLTTAVVG